MVRLAAVSLLVLATAACLGPGVDGARVDGGGTVADGGGGGTDGGTRTDGGTDGGTRTDGGALTDGGAGGGTVSDGGLDGGPGGTSDAGSGGGSSDAGAFGDAGGGSGPCAAGETRCNGPRLQTCSGGTFAAPVDCPTDQVCRGTGCVAVATCAGDTPPCCATSADCGTLSNFFSCPECRPAADGPSCLAGVCESAPPPQIDFGLIADATGLPGSARVAVRSAAITVYRGITADGRLVSCPMLLPASGTGPHDAQDPTLDAVYSRYANFQFSTGSDVFQVGLYSVPQGSMEAVVFSVYDGTGGTGTLLGRGRLDTLAPTAGGKYTLTLK